jgi:hypothetical protein
MIYYDLINIILFVNLIMKTYFYALKSRQKTLIFESNYCLHFLIFA